MSHNKQLAEMIIKVRDTACQAENEEELLPVFRTLRQFQREVGPIKYDNTVKWGVLFGLAVASVLLGIVFYALPPEYLLVGFGDASYFIVGGLALGAAVVGAWIALANSEIDTVSDLVFTADIMFDNRLRPVPIGGRGYDLYQTLYGQFGDFRGRGDEGHRIERLIDGEWRGGEHEFDYRYYRFRYVEVHYVPVTKKVGNTTVTTMERRTSTHYRYGLIMDFPYANGLAIQSGGGSFRHYIERFETASERFNGEFAVYTDDSHAAAKFLKPAVVLAFEQVGGRYSGLNVEINRQGKLNLSFSDSDLLDRERRHSISDPDAFEEEIRGHLALEKLNRLFRLVETMAKHNDSNFEVPGASAAVASTEKGV